MVGGLATHLPHTGQGPTQLLVVQYELGHREEGAGYIQILQEIRHGEGVLVLRFHVFDQQQR
jgi:hypothetical protein